MSESAITGVEPLLRRLVELGTRSRRTRPAMKQAADVVLGSIRKNFEVGGRPRWRGLAKSTLRNRKGGSILVRSGRLKGSFKPKVGNDETSVSSNVVYGPRQHFGYRPGRGKGGGRGQAPTPARPFATLQDEDVVDIGRIFYRHMFE